MLKIGIIGGNSIDWRDVSRRLHSAVVDPDFPLSSSDAVIALKSDESAIHRVIACGKALLLTEDALEMAAVVPPAYVLNRERYLPSRLLIRQQLERLGEVGLVRLHRWSAAPVPPTRDLDVVLWVVGWPPDAHHTLRGESGLLQIHLGFPGGGMALIAHASGLAYADGYSSLSVIASGGAAYADDHTSRQQHYTNGTVQSVRAGEDIPSWASMLQHWVDALREGRDLSGERNEWHRALSVAQSLEVRT